RVLSHLETLGGSGSVRIVPDDRSLIAVADGLVRVARIGVAERLEVLERLGGGGTAVARVGQQRDAVWAPVPLDARHRLDPSLDEGELSHHGGGVDGRPGAVGYEVFGDRAVSHMRRGVDR